MRPLRHWLDVRRGELRPLALSFLGAFSVMAFVVLGRALREALYLTRFEVTTLPYVMGATALLGVPAAVAFTRLMARLDPGVVFRALGWLLAAGLLVLWPLTLATRTAVVVFYLWTAVGSLLVASGFWVVTSEVFALREAKRLFGIIGGGGTLGAVAAGTTLSWLTARLGTTGTIPLLAACVAVLLGAQQFADRYRQRWAAREVAPAAEGPVDEVAVRGGLHLVGQSAHLRTLALIVFCATMASTLLDYQFKELAQENLGTSVELAGFFGAFYGWTGVLAFLIQVLVASRWLALAGVTAGLAVLPTLLLAGSVGLLAAPGFALVVLVRGADTSLRKSLHRFVLEYLYVPVPATLRRRTKAFIDSVVDSAAEGCGALLVFAWVTAAGLDARWLSAFVIAIAAAFLALAWRMRRHYLDTLLGRLRESDEALGDRQLVETRFDGKDLLTATYTGFDLQQQLAGAGDLERLAPSSARRGESEAAPDVLSGDSGSPGVGLEAADPEIIERTLDEFDDWDESHIEPLTRLLARRPLYRRAVDALLAIGEPAARHLMERLRDDDTDFVVRRRIPNILVEIDTRAADQALLDALLANRFEVRYRSAVALVRRRRLGLARAGGDWEKIVWDAVEAEVGRERPIWELQQLLDGAEAGADDFVQRRVGVRGELSLEHTFRLLSLVLDADAVRTAFHGVILDDPELTGVSLEYLEQVLPPHIRSKLWPFIGDISEYQRERSRRPVAEVVSDLAKSGATLFGRTEERLALRAALRSSDDEDADDGQ